MRLRFVSVALAPFLLLGAAAIVGRPRPVAADSLFEGIDAWSREMVLPSNAVWRGPRVAFPAPSARPYATQRLDSALLPVSVHGGPALPRAQLARVLAAAEDALVLWQGAGLFEVRGDGGQGGTSGYDLYVTPTAVDIDSGVDATQPVRELDGARAFALLDPRVSAVRLRACVAEALADALLRELDPAEHRQLRRASAAYFGQLVTGDAVCGAPEQTAEDDVAIADARVVPADFGPWLSALGARHDRNRGRFVADLWQLARQRTWEGDGLRASPTLLEAVEAVLRSEDEPLQRVLGELAGEAGRRTLLDTGGLPELARLAFAEMPVRLPPSAPLAPFASTYALVQVSAPQPGERLTAWFRGEYGVRWALSALRLDADMRTLGSVTAKVRDAPSGELHVELYQGTAYVLVSLTNGSGLRVPTLGPGDAPLVHAAQLILDRRVGF